MWVDMKAESMDILPGTSGNLFSFMSSMFVAKVNRNAPVNIATPVPYGEWKILVSITWLWETSYESRISALGQCLNTNTVSDSEQLASTNQIAKSAIGQANKNCTPNLKPMFSR